MDLRIIRWGVLLLVTASGMQILARAQHFTKPPRTAATAQPCDIYASAGTPCVAAHSTTRALYAGYRGPLYQVKRIADGATLDIRPAALHVGEQVAYADAAAQDDFCSHALCVLNIIYDQSGRGNNLYQAAPGTFKGPAKGGFDTQPIADMAPVSIHSHKVYGAYFMPGMGLRNNDASFLPTEDEPQGIYFVVDGTHFDNGCCFDYGNASTNGRAVGTGTMDTTYFGSSTVWGKGAGAGPWLMTDMEAGLFSGHSAKQNVDDPTVDRWRFVTAVVDGGGGNFWDLRGGNAQRGALATFYSGPRPDPSPSGAYFPMRRQGGLLLGTGGDNGNGSAGTFYEGVITAGRPSKPTTDAVQANIVAAHYSVAPVRMSRLRAFAPHSSQELTVTFTNAETTPATGLHVRLALPNPQWKSLSSTTGTSSTQLQDTLAAGSSKTFTFNVTSPLSPGSGQITAVAEWDTARHRSRREIAVQIIRSVPWVKLNEIRFGTASNPTDQFIELYNASNLPIDLSSWTLVHTPSQWSPFTLATIPPRTILAPQASYVLALAPSGLVAPTSPTATVLHVRSTSGMAAGQTIYIDAETRNIVSLGTAASDPTTVFAPVSTGPRLTIPAGAFNLPVTRVDGFTPGQEIAIDAGGHEELATVTAVGKPATQTTLAEAATACADHLLLASGRNVLPGDIFTIDTGQRKEIVSVTVVARGTKWTKISLAHPLKFDHRLGIDASDRGTGISFSPATHFAHASGDAVRPLGSGIVLDRPLQHAHPEGAPVLTSGQSEAGHKRQPIPNEWFGTPLSPLAGSIALMDASNTLVVDAIVYGSRQSNSSARGAITSPDLAVLEGDQGGGGCIVVVPASSQAPGAIVARSPDGVDTGSICTDFRTQAVATVLMNPPAGTANLKLSSISKFSTGQTVQIGSRSSQESAMISNVGTPRRALTIGDTRAGATVLSVSTTEGLLSGQTRTVGSGKKSRRRPTSSLPGQECRGQSSSQSR
jgi:hypothetical protein